VVVELSRHQRLDALFALPDALDREQHGAAKRLALLLGDRRLDDDVDRAGLIFKGREDHAARRAGLLPVSTRPSAAQLSQKGLARRQVADPWRPQSADQCPGHPING